MVTLRRRGCGGSWRGLAYIVWSSADAHLAVRNLSRPLLAHRLGRVKDRSPVPSLPVRGEKRARLRVPAPKRGGGSSRNDGTDATTRASVSFKNWTRTPIADLSP